MSDGRLELRLYTVPAVAAHTLDSLLFSTLPTISLVYIIAALTAPQPEPPSSITPRPSTLAGRHLSPEQSYAIIIAACRPNTWSSHVKSSPDDILNSFLYSIRLEPPLFSIVAYTKYSLVVVRRNILVRFNVILIIRP